MQHRPAAGPAADGGDGLVTAPQLSGRHILLVEDDYFAADDLATSFGSAGAQVVGPAASIDHALGLIARTQRLDGAVVDINLGGTMSYDVVDRLRARGVPVVFASGYDRTTIAAPYRDIPLCEKPVDLKRCAKLLFG
ncbi:response regulator (plasmid) [Paracoccus liaowanqingii]|uniref:Response regulator n=1 Tax=Paracoccus liaowanqingii TaxID=2560053 RepID=A0A4Y5SUZ1_9RHOB|nr:response regulator [Paracoccus liaowanqingii]